MTTVTPPAPPAPPTPGPQTPPPTGPTGPSSAARVVSTLAIVVGGIVVVGAVTSAVVSTTAAASTQTSTRTLAVDGVEDLDLDLAAGDLRVEFADIQDAELEVTSSFGADRWTLRRDGSELVVASPDWPSGWFGNWFGSNGTSVLRLPQELAGLDADLDVSAGDLNVTGDFADLELTVGAGRLEVRGSADDLSADISAGRADLDIADARSADLNISAGELVANLSGRQPNEIELDVSAGSLELAVPRGEYNVTSDVSAGSFDNRIGSTPGASSTVDVKVSAGNAELRAG